MTIYARELRSNSCSDQIDWLLTVFFASNAAAYRPRLAQLIFQALLLSHEPRRGLA